MARSPKRPAVPGVDDPIAAPRFGALWATLVYAVATMTLAYPALAGKFLVNPNSDQYIAGYAFRNFAAQWLKAGKGFPQWNPFLQGGLPYVAAMHGDIFYPTFLLRMILPTDAAMTWEFPIHLVLAGLFMYLFLRAWRFGFVSALIGGLAYNMSGSLAGLASPGHDGKLFVAALTPLALLLVTRTIRDGRRWAWGAFAVVVGLAFLTPHPQAFEYLMILAGAFALWVAFADHPGSGQVPRRLAIRRLAFALGCVVLGVLIGAIQYWPSLIEYKPWSPRAGGHDWATATSYSYPIEEVLNWYWPQFSGILQNYWGRNLLHYHSDYFGVIALILAGACFGKTARRSFRLFWLITGAVSLVWAFGGYTPFFHIVMAIVPETKYLRAPSVMIYVTALSTSVLAAIGTERMLARDVSVKYALAWIISGLIFAILMTAGGYTALSSAVVASMSSEMPQYADHFAAAAQGNYADAIIGVWRSFLFVLLGGGALWAWTTGRLNARTAAIAIAALVAADLWTIERMYWIFSPPAATLYASNAAVDAIKADMAKSGPARVLNPRIGNIALELGHQDRAFTGDVLMVQGLRVAEGYHGNELGMYDALMAQDSGEVEITPRFWRHENVQYLYTVLDTAMAAEFAAQVKSPPLIKLAGPVKDYAGSMVYAYKMPMQNPAAWVAAAIIKAPQDRALGAVLDPAFNPGTVLIADTSATTMPAAQISALPAPASTKATVTTFEPGAIDVSLDQPATAGQGLVVSENYFPGWHATVDGKDASLGLANFNLIGVALPAGARNVELRFTDAAYEEGKVVTLIALALALILWIGGAAMERRTVGAAAA